MSQPVKPVVNYMSVPEEGVANADTGSLGIPLSNSSSDLQSPSELVVQRLQGTEAPLSAGGGSEEPETTVLCSNETTLPSLFAKGTEIFKDWICPISFKLMVDPVVAQDGHTYERTAIDTWLLNNSTSPMDRSPITNKKLYTNIGLKGAIQLWKNNNPDLVKEDEQLDRQIDIASLRTKPTSNPLPRQSPLITVSLPRWDHIHDLLSRSSSLSFSPRITHLMRNNSSSRVIPV
jgi:hypothetical protein